MRRIGVYSGKGVASESLKRIVEIFKKNFYVMEFTRDVPNVDVLIMPGGLASQISLALGKDSLHDIEHRVRSGMKYIGICAGAYLAIEGYWNERTLTDELVLLKTHHPDINNWKRGKGFVRVFLKDHPMTFNMSREISMWYENGPIFSEGNYEVVGLFEDEINEINSPLPMKGSPAIVLADYEKGKVVLFSPHPEFSGSEGEKLLMSAATL